MATYTSLTTTDVNEILKLYQLPTATFLTPMPHGISNTNYLVELASKETVLLKVSNDKDFRQLQEEMEILLYLQKQNFSLSLTPFLTQEGSPVYHYQQYIGVIFPKAPGKVREANGPRCEAMGTALAQLHQVPTSSTASSTTLRDYGSVGFDIQKIQDYCLLVECPSDFLEAYLAIKQSAEWEKFFEFTQQTNRPTAIIHGDLYYDNVFFEDDKITTLLDFEQSGVGCPYLDLGIAITGSCIVDQKINFQLTQSYLAGYEKIRPIEKDGKIHLNTYMKLGLLSISLWRIKRFFEGNLSKEKKYSYRELLMLLKTI
ncbi:MAG: phosphotransferase [Bacteriovoracaceae bacterium]|nr:phosphotransferase [Bacteriovoracaceae bacterium]